MQKNYFLENKFVENCNIPLRLHTFFVKSQIASTEYSTLRNVDKETTVVLQSGEILEHEEITRMICLRGFQLVGNNLVECFQGRIVRDVGKCVPS